MGVLPTIITLILAVTTAEAMTLAGIMPVGSTVDTGDLTAAGITSLNPINSDGSLPPFRKWSSPTDAAKHP